MHIIDIIVKKRNKLALSKEEIFFVVNGYTNKEIPDYQMSSLLMAIFLNGMNDEETFYLTEAMLESGDKLSYPKELGVIVDKHSTGGIGDKTTLIIAPIVASLGLKMAKMSGKGLGFTGGTIDKLQSIDNFKVSLTDEEFNKNLKDVGAVLIYQKGNLTPADKMMYALRDVTGTVESIPLIASSIMSKKLAAGADVIVLDVKVGTGAFMKNISDAKKLAELMVKIGKHFNRKVVALLTNMDAPLGNNIGNKLEVQEALSILNGEEENDLSKLSIELASYIVSLAKKIEIDEARELVKEVIRNKKAFLKLKEIITNQGGIYESILTNDVKDKVDVLSVSDGYIKNIDAEKIGRASMLLGSGRETLDDKIDYEVGIVLNKHKGEYVSKGESLLTMYVNKDYSSDIISLILKAYTFSVDTVKKDDLILGVIK